MFFTVISTEAQIEVATDGHFSIGDAAPNSYELLLKGDLYVDVIQGNIGVILNGSGYPPPCPSCVSWPRLYPSTGSTGSFGSSTYTWHDAHIQTVYYTTLSGPSDIRLKDNIRLIKNPLQTIMSLEGIMFDYNTEKFAPRDEQGKIIEGSIQLKDRYGFSAQAAREVIPSVVSEVDEYLNMNYIDLIPILVEAMKEQQTIIGQYEERLSELELAQSSALKSLSTGVEDFTSSGAQLFQNEPNPFSENTIIKYNLPETARAAYITIYNMTGKQIMSQSIPTNITESQISIAGGEFDAGMYMYSLLVDGQLIDTKQMVITD